MPTGPKGEKRPARMHWWGVLRLGRVLARSRHSPRQEAARLAPHAREDEEGQTEQASAGKASLLYPTLPPRHARSRAWGLRQWRSCAEILHLTFSSPNPLILLASVFGAEISTKLATREV